MVKVWQYYKQKNQQKKNVFKLLTTLNNSVSKRQKSQKGNTLFNQAYVSREAELFDLLIMQLVKLNCVKHKSNFV